MQSRHPGPVSELFESNSKTVFGFTGKMEDDVAVVSEVKPPPIGEPLVGILKKGAKLCY